MTIQRQRREARQEIDAAAAEARMRYLTKLPGQDMVYAAKLAQAKAYRASVVLGVPTAQPGSYLVSEAAVKGCSALTLADAVIAKATAWDDQHGPAIEAERMRGSMNVLAAATGAAVDAAAASAVSALEAL